jgi:hypothetical protein
MKEKMYMFDMAATALIGSLIGWTLSKGFEITTASPLAECLVGLAFTAVALCLVKPARRWYENSD